MKKNIIMPIVSLLVICLVLSGAVSVTYYFTKDKIAMQDAAKITQSIALLLPDAADTEVTEADSFTYYDCYDSAQTQIGRAYLIDTRGYGGTLTLMVAFKADMSTAGIQILSSSETPGLGKKSESEGFLAQFRDKIAESFEVIKGDSDSDSEIEAISGATITTRAVVGAVNTALQHYRGEAVKQ